MTNLRTISAILKQIDGEKSVLDIVRNTKVSREKYDDGKGRWITIKTGINRKTCDHIIDLLETVGIVKTKPSSDGERGRPVRIPQFTEKGLEARTLLIDLGNIDSRQPQY